MAGVYIHIPFCRKACHYCNFHFSATAGNFNEMADAICKEAVLRSEYINEPVSSIYFGGGTPSLIPTGELHKIFSTIVGNFNVLPDAEVTLEANPDDIHTASLAEWRVIGINRLSIGIQSFFQEDLTWMNRAHSAEQAMEAILLSKAAGYDDLNIDLIYGTPTLTDENWRKNVEKAINFDIPHVSCYALTVEPKTALHGLIAKGKFKPVNEEDQGRQFELLMQWMEQAGYQHYEISNFSKPGKRSRHNTSYWQGKPYLGLGPSAHSFNGESRQWNVSNNALYLKAIRMGNVPFEIEFLSSMQQLNEYIMTSLRMNEGVDLQIVRRKWGKQKEEKLRIGAKKYIDLNLMNFSDNRLLLTSPGKHYADGIAADLFFVE